MLTFVRFMIALTFSVILCGIISSAVFIIILPLAGKVWFTIIGLIWLAFAYFVWPMAREDWNN